jgi:hypothetical protein
MKIIKRLNHTDTFMVGSIMGWDIFWCRDYSNVDGKTERGIDGKTYMPDTPAIYGYTIILALNLGSIRFFKRLFIKIK